MNGIIPGDMSGLKFSGLMPSRSGTRVGTSGIRVGGAPIMGMSGIGGGIGVSNGCRRRGPKLGSNCEPMSGINFEASMSWRHKLIMGSRVVIDVPVQFEWEKLPR